MGAKKKPQETVSLADLGLDAGEVGEHGSRPRSTPSASRPRAARAARIEDDGDAAAAILEYLAEKKLV